MKTIQALLCTLALLTPAIGEAQSNQDPLTIKLDADSTEADGANGVIRFSGVTITQGVLSVRAQSAQSSSLDFADSTWTFEGDVRFASADTELTAARAELTFSDQELTRARLDGAPLVFEQSRNGDVRLTSRKARIRFQDNAVTTARFTGTPVEYGQAAGGTTTSARADELRFDAAQCLITLLGNAWIGDDGKEIEGNSIKYNCATRSYVASSDDAGDQRVTITITPPQNNDNDNDPE